MGPGNKAALDERMTEIFPDEIYRNGGIYQELLREFTELIEDMEEGVPLKLISEEESMMHTIFAFIYNAKEITMIQYAKLHDLMAEIRTSIKERI